MFEVLKVKQLSEDGAFRNGLWSWQRSILVLFFFSAALVFCLSITLESGSTRIVQLTKQFAGSASDLSTSIYRGSFSYSFSPSTSSAQNPQIDSACLGRTGHKFYSKSWVVLPEAPVFQEAWKKYTDLHYKCTSNIANWTELFLQGNPPQDQTCKFLIYMEGGEGLGNRLMSLVSAFTYAIATNRVLLLNSRGHLAALLCEPFPKSSWLLPLDFPFDDVHNSPTMAGLMEPDFNGSTIVLHLGHIQSGQDQNFFCREWQMKLAGVKWVGFESTQYYLTTMLTMPMIWERMHLFFPDGVPIFPYIARRLLLPINDVWAVILRVYLNYMSPSDVRVGAQIRLHGRGNLAEFDEKAYKRVIDCFTTNNILPAAEVAENLTQLEYLSVANREKEPRISVLVASLQGKYYESIKGLYADHPAGGGKLVKIHTLSSQGNERSSDMEQSKAALAEMWLLSFSDHIAISAYSTFGYVAHGLAGLKPYILNIRGDLEKNETPACYQGQSAEPCTHFPMKPYCMGINISTEHQAWIETHVKTCLDQTNGHQLVW